MAFSQEALQYLLANGYNPGVNGMPQWVDPSTGTQYFGKYQQGPYGGEGSNPTMTLNGVAAGNYDAKKGGQFTNYDLSGNQTGTEQWKPDDWNFDNAAILAALGVTGANLLAAGGLGGGVNAGAANGSWDVLPAASGAPNTAAMGAGGATVPGSSLFSSSLDLPAAQSLSAVKDIGSAAGGFSGLLGPAATVLGALAGSKGVKQTQTSTREPWGPVGQFATETLFPAAKSLLNTQMQTVPQQAQQIQNYGMGLLSQPIAGNGYSLFANRKFGG